MLITIKTICILMTCTFKLHVTLVTCTYGLDFRGEFQHQSFISGYVDINLKQQKVKNQYHRGLFFIFHKPMFKTQHILSSTHMANFNILILPSNQNSENILFLVYRWCCNRKREQLPVGGELLQATCSLKYQLLE